LGIIVGELFYQLKENKSVKIPIITILLAWSVSISVGYNTPALFIGGALSMMFFYSIISTQTKNLNGYTIAILTLLTITLYYTRTLNIYRDLPSKNLTYKLDNLVEGAHGIYTNKNTYDVSIAGIGFLKKRTTKYCLLFLILLPAIFCILIESKILTEWPNKTEIPNDKILEKTTCKIKHDSTLVFAIPVFQTALLKDGFTPQENGGINYPIVKLVKENYSQKSFSKYFEIHRK
jgi:hypothetical protein